MIWGFAGSSAFALHVLQHLQAQGYRPELVLSQAPQPARRGHKLLGTPVATWAEEQGLKLYTPAKLDAAAVTELSQHPIDWLLVVAYGQLLGRSALAWPRLGCLNLHASLLPRWRGAAPIERAVLAGDATTGVCLMQMEAGLDTGPVLAQASCPISEDTTAGELHRTLANLGVQLVLDFFASDRALVPPQGQVQASQGITYAARLDKLEAHIQWAYPAATVLRQIHAFSPRPGAFCFADNLRLVCTRARLSGLSGPVPGQVLPHPSALVVACGEGALELVEVKKAGGHSMSGEALLLGHSWLRGQRLS